MIFVSKTTTVYIIMFAIVTDLVLTRKVTSFH